MKPRNWRTSLGGAIGVFGTGLIGVAFLSSMYADVAYKKIIFGTAFAGFVLSASGKAITAFFAADAREVERLQKSYDTEHFKKSDLPGVR